MYDMYMELFTANNASLYQKLYIYSSIGAFRFVLRKNSDEISFIIFLQWLFYFLLCFFSENFFAQDSAYLYEIIYIYIYNVFAYVQYIIILSNP